MRRREKEEKEADEKAGRTLEGKKRGGNRGG